MKLLKSPTVWIREPGPRKRSSKKSLELLHWGLEVEMLHPVLLILVHFPFPLCSKEVSEVLCIQPPPFEHTV